MSNIKTRALTGFFFIAILIGSVIFDPLVFVGVFFGLTALCLNEFYTLLEERNHQPQTLMGLFTGTLLFASGALINLGRVPFVFLTIDVLLICAVFINELFIHHRNPFGNIAYTLLGICYIAIPFALFCSLGFMTPGQYQWELPMGFLILLWANDTGAYLAGINFGRTKLMESVSPKKTWEGFFGGLVAALALAWTLHYFWGLYSLFTWMSISFLITVFGTLGDLVESLFKRSIDTKDSGSILPGHGGVLDRFDGLFLSAPMVFIYLHLMRYFALL